MTSSPITAKVISESDLTYDDKRLDEILLLALQNAPAVDSCAGWVDRVPGARHASLLGPRYAHRVVRGFEHVLSVSRAG